jgi:hypothetical protein
MKERIDLDPVIIAFVMAQTVVSSLHLGQPG